MKIVRITVLVLAALVFVFLAGCGEGTQVPEGLPETPGSTEAPAQPVVDGAEPGQNTPDEGQTPGIEVSFDRDGNPIKIPDKIERVMSIGPSNTEVLVALGFADKIIATDEYSNNIPGIDPALAMFSMMAPDGERIISMAPDVIFVTGMSMSGGDDPFAIIASAGICLIYIPSSTSIEGIIEDIRFMAAVMSVREKGEELVANMEAEIAEIRAVGETIAEKRSVYFEIAAAPFMYSFGYGTFLNEMIEMIGAVNIFADTESWTSVSDEVVLDADPDVILTSVNYIDDPVGEIMSRSGWNGVKAIKNNEVHYISTDASNRPSHNIVIAMRAMAEAIYPEHY